MHMMHQVFDNYQSHWTRLVLSKTSMFSLGVSHEHMHKIATCEYFVSNGHRGCQKTMNTLVASFVCIQMHNKRLQLKLYY